MRQRALSTLLIAVTLFVTAAAQSHAAKHAAEPQARLLPGMGHVHHSVSTSNPEAQRYFDQGLALIYGFNHDEGARSFRRAAELDPKMAMAWWGVALAVGPNYNLPVDQERELQAFEAIQKARALSVNGPKNERAYIEALAKRYTNQPTTDYLSLERAYNNAMRQLSRAYPDDLDAATLFAESGMNLRPWKLWNADGTPAPGTEEIVATLESVLRRDPNHIGANHYYIHAVEASKHPERALASANRLAPLTPAAGHLVHMPAHIYTRTGDYEASARTNELAAQADENYIRETNAQGIYPMMYYTHNLHFLVVENANMGRFDDAMSAAQRVEKNIAPHLRQMPMLDGFNALRPAVLVRFQRWNEILALPKPDPSLAMTSGMWHFARGLAYASRGEVQQARAELAQLEKYAPAMSKVPTNPTGPHNASIMPQIGANLIRARIAQSRNQNTQAIMNLRQAVVLQDSMDYSEPPDWIIPTREWLGAVLLKDGKPVEAERVFREQLERTPRSGRSLFGLAQALKAQNRNDDAVYVQQQYEAAWKHADSPLRMADLIVQERGVHAQR